MSSPLPPVVQVDQLSFSHAEIPVLDRVSFSLEPGFTGLIGGNGAGKSTLLSLLAGHLRPQAGTIRAPQPVHLCPQEVVLDEAIEAFAWGWVEGAWALQSRLGLDPAQLERFATLSPGERRRWQVGAALAHQPAVLLLDEPTDHLDVEARQWLIEALRLYPGCALVVSHDRAFLDALVHTVLRLDRGQIVCTRGGATQALAAWDEARRQTVAELQAASLAVRAAKAQLSQARRDHQEASASVHASSRMKDRHDSDARSMGAKVVAGWAATTHGRRVEVARSALQRAERLHASLERPDEVGGEVIFRSAPGARSRLIAWRGELRAGDRLLAKDLELVVERGEHVHLAGPNGAGKSTLLKTVLSPEHLHLPSDKVLWLPQELPPERVEPLLDALRSLDPASKGRVLQAVACLGVRPERLLATARPSPGEARKLALAMGLGQGAWLLALDEPTNHLDLPSIAALQRALASYDGALLLVTHDPALAEATTHRTFFLAERTSPDLA